MKWMRRILITLILLGAVCTGAYIFYHDSYTKAYAMGEREGCLAGGAIGYNLGKQDGYDCGRNAGYTVGEVKGYTVGEVKGYSLGKQDGYLLGKRDGYKGGQAAGYIWGKIDGYYEGVWAAFEHSYTLRDPTHSEALAFLIEDKTDEKEYIDPDYVCVHFARDVCNNAETQGLHCAFVGIAFPDTAPHTIIAFNTIDKGLIYFEPQTDEKIKPIIGQHYYEDSDVSFDDTIMDILVIW